MDESWDALQERHRNEIRALKARVMALKKSATQGDKKKKKEVTAEIGALEAELADRHAREEREFKAAHPPPASDAPAEAPAAAAAAADPAEASSADAEEAEPAIDAQSSAPRVTRAARRRTKKQERADEARQEAEREAAAMPNMRAMEDQQLEAALAKLSLRVGQIPADGNCLFSAIAEQHARLGGAALDQLAMRRMAAAYMRSHADEFAPFLTDADGEPLEGEEAFRKYLVDLETTAMWGGQPEITALSHSLRRPVHVWMASAPKLVIGAQYEKDSGPVQLSYHRHAYGLGEHYNSVIPA